ncbi:hypothetical protein CMV60_10425 [Serratia marcescens]|nr:hypothetical protein CMV60_10425 [Serratia marcescens]
MGKKSPRKLREFNFELAKSTISYDCNTGCFTWLVSKGGAKKGSQAGCIDNEGYIRVTLNGNYAKGHVLAWFLHYGILPDGIIDHINTIKGDNRISNLRIASASDNQRNKGLQRNNTSGAKGVWWNKRERKFVAQGYIKGVRKHIGSFRSLDEAKDAYCKWAEVHYGEFARFN